MERNRKALCGEGTRDILAMRHELLLGQRYCFCLKLETDGLLMAAHVTIHVIEVLSLQKQMGCDKG